MPTQINDPVLAAPAENVFQARRRSTPAAKIWFHVDMDGLDAIFQGHGHVYGEPRDDFYVSAVDSSLRFFEERDARATYFVIARDLDRPDKRRAIEQIVSAGHYVACHGLNHKYLNRISSAEKREEIISGKKKIEDALGVPVYGFRAPGYSIDLESLRILRDAGYLYDSSIFPNYEFRNRLGLERLHPEPFLMFPEDGFFELPMPYNGPWLPPFHPCYAFYLSRFYFRRSLEAFRKRHSYCTLLFHLTDFAAPQKLRKGLLLDIFTNNFVSASKKLRFLNKLMKPVEKHFTVTTSEELLLGWPDTAPDLSPSTILGVSTTHETGACLVRDGEVVAALNEERMTRRKLDNRYPPVESIREVIRMSGIDPQEIDAVAIAGLHWKDLLPRIVDSLRRDLGDFHAWNDYFPHFCRLAYRLFYFWRALRYDDVREFLLKEYGIRPKPYYVEHQEAHASAAYRTGTSRKALIITADGVGDELSITFSEGSGSTIRRIQNFFYPHSFGQFYTACTQILGFKGGRHEGKITGLAGYGKPDPELLRKVESTFIASDGGFRLNKRYYAEGFLRLRAKDLRRFDILNVDYRNYKKPLKNLLRNYSREDVAYAFQHLLEREMVRLAQRHVNGQPVNIVMAGGVMSNVKLNMALGKELPAESLYIFPNMGDGGLCVGAALSVLGSLPAPVRDMYLGTEFTPEQALEALAKHSYLRFERPDDMAGTVARALAGQKIVARCAGRMEFGPRALGNRSILYHCSDRSVNDWLNRQLNRTEFMPFAPICLEEDSEEYFFVPEGQSRPCEFMTLVVKCTEKMQKTCPAAVHVDGTARPQLVAAHRNPGIYEILKEYKRLTGISCLINTSFNMHEEPIIRSPEEAIRAFEQSHIHHLVLGPYFVSARTQ
jgi:carbamoyltransferase